MKKNLFFILAVTLVIISCSEKDSAAIPGNIRKFDPVESYEKVHTFAGEDTGLISIIAYYVKPDGTIDLKADYKPGVYYSFYQYIDEVIEKKGGPLGSGIEEDRIEYKSEYINVSITEPHYYTIQINLDEPETKYDPGMNRTNSKSDKEFDGSLIAPPALTFKDIWDRAADMGTPYAVAVITYDCNGYRFFVKDTDISFQFDFNGELIE